MPETMRYKYQKRVVFPPGKQKAFLETVLKNSGLSPTLIALRLEVHPRTCRDWLHEKYSLPISAFQKLRRFTKGSTLTGIEIKGPFWYAKKGGELAGRLVYQKYGGIKCDPKKRLRRWQEWWDKVGRFNRTGYFVPKEIALPSRSSRLAEFMGILMGDGGITKRQVTITLSYWTDRPYSEFVGNLIYRLFKVKPSFYLKREASVVAIVVSRTKLVEFCKSLGLKVGNKIKQDLDIPEWIKGNVSYKIACVRGLVDTDGCIFNECHRINGRRYCYPRLSFVSHSRQLRNSVFLVLSELGFSPKIRNNRSVQLESKENIVRYFRQIGTNNENHKTRYASIVGGVG